VWKEAECRKRAPHPNPAGGRAFPITQGEDGCGDYAIAGKSVYNADYAETLGQWINMADIMGRAS
jgi:hypothetical protein